MCCCALERNHAEEDSDAPAVPLHLTLVVRS
jgi:hypothetical protein